MTVFGRSELEVEKPRLDKYRGASTDPSKMVYKACSSEGLWRSASLEEGIQDQGKKQGATLLVN